VRMIVESEADLVLNALVGSAGLGPTVAALGEGIDLALANKESLVVGGELVMALAEATGARITPVDSEHTALHQLIAGQPPGAVQRLTITASGGPFRGRSRQQLRDVTVAEALAHHLFVTPYERIEVVVHPQSLIHGLVQLADGAMLAHLGPPDMRIAISYALNRGESVELGITPLDLAQVGALTFEAVDLEAFPCLALARQAAAEGGTAPCVLNAANEIAVHAFLEGGLGFLDISAVIEETLSALAGEPLRDFESLYEADREARRLAGESVAALRL
jgi:1-deoxy-D-xylulose-5-phosphate reductoisomerase